MMRRGILGGVVLPFLVSGVAPERPLGQASAGQRDVVELHVPSTQVAVGARVSVRAAGQVARAAVLYVYVHSGSEPCAPTSWAENRRIDRRADAVDQTPISMLLDRPPRTFDQQFFLVPSVAGVYHLCAYVVAVPETGRSKPLAAASAELAVSQGGGGGESTTAPFTFYGLRLQLSEEGDPELTRPSIDAIRSGQKAYLFYYVRFNRAVRAGTQVEFTITDSCIPNRDRPNTNVQTLSRSYRPGDKLGTYVLNLWSTPERRSCTLTGGVRINGVSQTRTTQVMISP